MSNKHITLENIKIIDGKVHMSEWSYNRLVGAKKRHEAAVALGDFSLAVAIERLAQTSECQERTDTADLIIELAKDYKQKAFDAEIYNKSVAAAVLDPTL